MRRVPVRFALGAAALGLLVTALPSSAAPSTRPFVLVDPTDDTMPMTHGDIVAVTYTTTGRGPVPDTLLVTIQTADEIDADGTTEYEVDSQVAGCANGFDVWFTPGVAGSEGGGCSNGSGSSLLSTGLAGPPEVRRHSVTFAFPFAKFPGKQVRPGTAIRGIRAFTALVEPVVGFIGPYVLTGGLANDELVAERAYRVG